jgi:hypothetical protein
MTRKRRVQNERIHSIIGWDISKERVIAKCIDGNLFAGTPELVAEIANDVLLARRTLAVSVPSDSSVDAKHTRAFL